MSLSLGSPLMHAYLPLSFLLSPSFTHAPPFPLKASRAIRSVASVLGLPRPRSRRLWFIPFQWCQTCPPSANRSFHPLPPIPKTDRPPRAHSSCFGAPLCTICCSSVLSLSLFVCVFVSCLLCLFCLHIYFWCTRFPSLSFLFWATLCICRPALLFLLSFFFFFLVSIS